MPLCPLCGEPLVKDGEYNICLKGCSAYIDSDTQSMDEVIASIDMDEDNS